MLSAGKGTRMLPLTMNTPKCLLDLGLGTTVLEHQLKTILEYNETAKNKIWEIVIVVGYLAEQIEAKLNKYNKMIKIKTIYNPFYDVSNNMMSLWMAIPEMNDEFVLINGDNVFNTKVLQTICDPKIDEGICMVVDKRDEYDEDDMKVVLKKNKVVKVSKKIPPKESNGESVGIIRFQDGGISTIKKVLREMVRDIECRNVFYLQALQRIMDDDRPVKYAMIDVNDWAEIDFHNDLDVVQNQVQEDIKRFLEKSEELKGIDLDIKKK